MHYTQAGAALPAPDLSAVLQPQATGAPYVVVLTCVALASSILHTQVWSQVQPPSHFSRLGTRIRLVRRDQRLHTVALLA